MKKVYIVGGNGFARECYLTFCSLMKERQDLFFAGFLGHGGYGHTVNYFNLQKYYLGEVSKHKFQKDEYVIIGAGYPELRYKIYQELKCQNVNFYTLCSPFVVLNPYIDIGEANVFIAPFAPSLNVKIGNGNVFNGDVTIGHDVEIGDFNFIGGKTQLLGGVKIGSNNTIGVASVFLPNSKIGDNNKIAPISAIYKGCKNNCYVHGNPALNVGVVE